MRSSAYGVLAAVVALGGLCRASSGVTVPRSRIVEAVRAKVQFAGELAGLSEAERAEFLRALDIDALAREVLPESMEAGPEEQVRCILERASKVTLEWADPEISKLSLQQRFMEVYYTLWQGTKFPVLSKSDREHLREAIAFFFERIGKNMERYVCELVTVEEICAETENYKRAVLAKMDDPTTPVMKRVISKKDVPALLRDLDGRLREESRRILEMFPELAGSDADGGAGGSENRSIVAKMLLSKVMPPLLNGLWAATTPESLRDMRPEDIVPEFTTISQRLREREFRKWQAQHEAERREWREELRKRRAEVEAKIRDKHRRMLQEYEAARARARAAAEEREPNRP